MIIALAAALALVPAARPAAQSTGSADRPTVIVDPGVVTVRGAETMLASELGAIAVVGVGGEDIGDVEDTILGRDGTVVAVLVGVGGVLGLGERLVAVPWDRIEVRDTEAGFEFVSELDRAALDAAPDYVPVAP